MTVFSIPGGVGRTAIASNLAAARTDHTKKVALDLQFENF